MAFLVDTNILVYRFDPRFKEKQRIANELLRSGVVDGSVRVPHQAIVEFVAVVTRVRAGSRPLLDPADARVEAEDMLAQFDVLYPDLVPPCDGFPVYSNYGAYEGVDRYSFRAQFFLARACYDGSGCH